MTFETATFNPREFELRNFTNQYVTPDQATDISLVESRVNNQLNFLAQQLGWNGPNYWTNLPSTPDQRRQLLGGSFGVYNGFILPRVLEVRNWNNTIVIDQLPLLDDPQQISSEKVILGFDEYEIQSLSVTGDTYTISLGTLPQSFYDQIAANEQLKITIPTLRPAPFNRPEVLISGDASFVVKGYPQVAPTPPETETSLKLYPSYDTQGQFEYESLSFFAKAVYYFDQPVYIKYDLTNITPDISPTFDSNRSLWFIKIPPTVVTSSTPVTVFLCWDYADSVSLNIVSTPVVVRNWQNPSDWGSLDTVTYYTGAWGNKGGPLPFNLVFDSLSIHGATKENAITLQTVERSLSYNSLVELVYSQQTPFDITAPGGPYNGDLWWNPESGALAVWYDPYNTGCSTWVEVDYRNEPEEIIVATLVYPDVVSFSAAAGTIPDDTTVLILDCTGLAVANGVVGLSGTITTSPSLYLYRGEDSPYWTPVRFTFSTVTEFNNTALILPFNIPVVISDANGLVPFGTNYNVIDLDFQVLFSVPAVLTKTYTNTSWSISPDSILQYISRSSLFNYENQGEMWWDYANPVYSTRAASIYIQSAWVSVNSHPLSGSPSYFFDPKSVNFYTDGNLITLGNDYTNGDYLLSINFNSATESYEVTYTPLDLRGRTSLPTLTISDSLTGTYTADITNLVFSGVMFGMTPSLADAETPLRLWKTEELQDAGSVARLVENNYENPLLADVNTGPSQVNWERYFVRLPLDYGRNESVWQKVALTCQDFGYWGTTILAEKMRCPAEDDLPVVYDELFIYDQPIQDYTYVYSEPYLYSNIAYVNSSETGDFLNSGFFPANDLPYDGYTEGSLVPYEPLHNRRANLDSPVGAGYGDWEGVYVNVNACQSLSGFLVNDLVDGAVSPVNAPIWDASIYKLPPTCENPPASYDVDSNHYKICYAYFVADASAAEDGFFDVLQPISSQYIRPNGGNVPNADRSLFETYKDVLLVAG